jgi:hypothetical protein
MESFVLFAAGISKPIDPPSAGQGQADNSSTHSCIFLDASVAWRPNARSEGVAASMLAFNLPDGLVNASRVVAGERSDNISSFSLGRVGDREGVRRWSRGGANRGAVGEKRGGSAMVAGC